MEDLNKKPSINIYYEKNPSYRTIYTDGVIGGFTPDNTSININFYATRHAIPKYRKHSINPDGSINQNGVPSEDSKSGMIREIELGIYMKTETAESIYEFLKKILNK